jgi:hypothetical protein
MASNQTPSPTPIKMDLGDDFLTLAYVTQPIPHPTHVYSEHTSKKDVFLQSVGVPLRDFTMPQSRITQSRRYLFYVSKGNCN